MNSFADDTHLIRWTKTLSQLTVDKEKLLESVMQWLRKSGFKVNDPKTEMCLFQRNDQLQIEITINNTKINIIDIGVAFDSKMQVHIQVAQTIFIAKKAQQTRA
jgi:DUF1009 family protein